MSDYETTLADVRREMAGEPAEVQLEYRIDAVVRELDELCAMANNPETVDLVAGQKIGIGQIISRATLIQSFLMARKPAPTHIRRVS
jgi:hypothetical protein